MICRVCGNAGHIGRDCPDRQRGASWRNDQPGPVAGRGSAGRIGGGGDAVDREYAVSLIIVAQISRILNSHIIATHARAFWECTRWQWRRTSTY